MSEVGYFAIAMAVTAMIVLVFGDKIWAWLKDRPWPGQRSKLERELRSTAPDPEITGDLAVALDDTQVVDLSVNYADIEGDEEPKQMVIYDELTPQIPTNWREQYVANQAGKHRAELFEDTETLPVLQERPILALPAYVPKEIALRQPTRLVQVLPSNQLMIEYPQPTLVEQVHDDFEKIKRHERREWDKLRKQVDNDLLTAVERIDNAVAEATTHGQYLQSMFSERINKANQHLEAAMKLVKEMQTA